MCVRATVCPSVCCVFMRVRGHLRVCATCKCVSLQFCNVNVHHFHSYHYCSIGMDIQYIMIWKVWYCFLQFHEGL